jgi:hypothetical protein
VRSALSGCKRDRGRRVYICVGLLPPMPRQWKQRIEATRQG